MDAINKKAWVGTKAQYLTTFPNGTDRATYIVDLPTVEISNADMALALTTQAKFYKDGQILICSDDGTYTKGHIYQYSTSGWTDITASGGGSSIEIDGSNITDDTTNYSFADSDVSNFKNTILPNIGKGTSYIILKRNTDVIVLHETNNMTFSGVVAEATYVAIARDRVCYISYQLGDPSSNGTLTYQTTGITQTKVKTVALPTANFVEIADKAPYTHKIEILASDIEYWNYGLLRLLNTDTTLFNKHKFIVAESNWEKTTIYSVGVPDADISLSFEVINSTNIQSGYIDNHSFASNSGSGSTKEVKFIDENSLELSDNITDFKTMPEELATYFLSKNVNSIQDVILNISGGSNEWTLLRCTRAMGDESGWDANFVCISDGDQYRTLLVTVIPEETGGSVEYSYLNENVATETYVQDQISNISSGDKLYQHHIAFTKDNVSGSLTVFNRSADQLTATTAFPADMTKYYEGIITSGSAINLFIQGTQIAGTIMYGQTTDPSTELDLTSATTFVDNVSEI